MELVGRFVAEGASKSLEKAETRSRPGSRVQFDFLGNRKPRRALSVPDAANREAQTSRGPDCSYRGFQVSIKCDSLGPAPVKMSVRWRDGPFAFRDNRSDPCAGNALAEAVRTRARNLASLPA